MLIRRFRPNLGMSRMMTGRFLGPELTINGNFANWTLDDPDDWIISEVGDATSNVTEHANGMQMIRNPTLTYARQDILIVSTMYKCVVVVDVASANINFVLRLGTMSSSIISTSGTHTFYMTADNIQFYIYTYNPCDCIINLSSVRAVL